MDASSSVPPASAPTSHQKDGNECAYVTMITSEPYAVAGLVLASSLRATGTPHKIVALISAKSLTVVSRNELLKGFDALYVIEEVTGNDVARLGVVMNPELGVTFFKLALWTLTQFMKVVYLDADTLVLSNIDDLFRRPELSAAPDPVWPDLFNAGVIVAEPRIDTYRDLLALSKTEGSMDGGDQGLLNRFFKQWSQDPAHFRLPYAYNVAASSSFHDLATFDHFFPQIKVIHYATMVPAWGDADPCENAKPKPWQEAPPSLSEIAAVESNHKGDRTTRSVAPELRLRRLWWEFFYKYRVNMTILGQELSRELKITMEVFMDAGGTLQTAAETNQVTGADAPLLADDHGRLAQSRHIVEEQTTELQQKRELLQSMEQELDRIMTRVHSISQSIDDLSQERIVLLEERNQLQDAIEPIRSVLRHLQHTLTEPIPVAETREASKAATFSTKQKDSTTSSSDAVGHVARLIQRMEHGPRQAPTTQVPPLPRLTAPVMIVPSRTGSPHSFSLESVDVPI